MSYRHRARKRKSKEESVKGWISALRIGILLYLISTLKTHLNVDVLVGFLGELLPRDDRGSISWLIIIWLLSISG